MLESVEFANTPADPDGYAIGEAIVVTATFSERVWVYGCAGRQPAGGGQPPSTMTYYPETHRAQRDRGTLEYLATLD